MPFRMLHLLCQFQPLVIPPTPILQSRLSLVTTSSWWRARNNCDHHSYLFLILHLTQLPFILRFTESCQTGVTSLICCSSEDSFIFTRYSSLVYKTLESSCYWFYFNSPMLEDRTFFKIKC